MSAVPNLFEFIIAEALEWDGATAESVATTIAASDPFLMAVRKGMDHQTPDAGVPTPAQVMRMALSKAFGAPTAGEMHD
ncbi:MAG: hypothetical protein ACRD0W_18230 [Acidimicrobiales bacterium]